MGKIQQSQRVRGSPAGPGTGAVPKRPPAVFTFSLAAGTGAGAIASPPFSFIGALAEGAGAGAFTAIVKAGLLGVIPAAHLTISIQPSACAHTESEGQTLSVKALCVAFACDPCRCMPCATVYRTPKCRGMMRAFGV